MTAPETRFTFYCIDSYLEEVPSSDPIRMTLDVPSQDFLPNMNVVGDFFGVLDETGCVLQARYEGDDNFWIEIPQPSRGGSFGFFRSRDQSVELFRDLPIQFREALESDMEFQHW